METAAAPPPAGRFGACVHSDAATGMLVGCKNCDKRLREEQAREDATPPIMAPSTAASSAGVTPAMVPAGWRLGRRKDARVPPNGYPRVAKIQKMLGESLKTLGPMAADDAGVNVEGKVNERIRHEQLDLIVTYDAQVFSIRTCADGKVLCEIPMVHGEVTLCN